MRHRFMCPLTIVFILVNAPQVLTAQEVLLRYKYTTGDSWKMKTSTQIHQEGEYIRDVNLSIDEVTSYHTEKVYEDSSADIITNLETSETHYFNEKVKSARELLNGVSVLVRLAANGRVLEMKPVEDVSSKKQEMIELTKKQLQLDEGFPTRALRIGEKWENKSAGSYDMGDQRIEQSLKISLKFIGFDKFAGVKCAIVTMNVEVKGTITTQFEEAPVSGSGKGEIVFNPESGKVLQHWMEFESRATISHKKGPMELRTQYSTKQELIQ